MSPQVLPLALRRHSSSAAAFSSSSKDQISSDPRRPVRRSAPGRPPPPIARAPLSLPAPQQTDVYVTSTSRICLARSLDGLLPSQDTLKASSSFHRNVNVHALRHVTYDADDDACETQLLVCWMEGSFVRVAFTRGNHLCFLANLRRQRRRHRLRCV